MKTGRAATFMFLAVLLGIGLGLFYAWIISPVQYIDTNPATLRADFKDSYRALIATAYIANGDIERARARLMLLGDEDSIQALNAQAQRTLARGGSSEVVRALALLAVEIQNAQTVLAPNTPAPQTIIPTMGITEPTATPEPTLLTGDQTPIPTSAAALQVTPSPRPTLTPTATLGIPFIVQSQEPRCEAAFPDGLLQIFVKDAAGKAITGKKITLTWNGGTDFAFTGFKPEINDGYADFLISPNIQYSVQLADGGATVSGVSLPACKDANNVPYWGSFRIIFQQP